MTTPTHTDKDGNPKCCASCVSYQPDGKGMGVCTTWNGLHVAGISLCERWKLKSEAPTGKATGQ